MVDIFYFTVCFVSLCFCLLMIGWNVGYTEAKRKYRRKERV